MTASSTISLDYSHGGTWAVYSPTVVLDAGTHTSTDYIYIPNLGGIQNSIKCNKNTFVWADNSASGTPSSVITSGGYVYLGDGHDGTSGVASSNFTTFRGRFAIPSALVSSGTSTEEVFVPDAKIVNYGGATGNRFEQRGYPAASYELTGPGATSNWTLTSQSNNLQYHISNLNPGTYHLWQDSVEVATLVALSSKVFCNFW